MIRFGLTVARVPYDLRIIMIIVIITGTHVFGNHVVGYDIFIYIYYIHTLLALVSNIPEQK